MGIPFEMLLVTSTVGALQSLFFGIYLFTVRKTRNTANVLLGLLLIAFTFRIIKSVSYYFAQDHVIPDVLMNLGFGCNLAIFPLLWLYLKAFLDRDYRFDWRRDAWHLLPAGIIIALSPVLTDYFWLSQNGYSISLLAMLLYVPFCIHLVWREFGKLTRSQRLWVLGLIGGVVVVWFGYIGNFVFGLVPYIASPVAFSIIMYFLGFVVLKEGAIFRKDEKYVSSTYGQHHLDNCYSDLLALIDRDQPFKDPAITLPKLAAKLGVSSNLLSETINSKTGQSFPDFVNGLRIQMAQNLLQDPDYDSHKIAAIAFQAGFNSLSVFNAAFKKFTAQTPSAYRKNTSRR